MSRIEESVRNSIASIGIQAGTVILSFISRTVLIKTLGEQYLGISGLFGNILSMLSLAELGVGSTMLYFMYKPMVEQDERKLNILMAVYAKVYNIIGLAIMVAGLLLSPFLGIFMKEVPDIPHLTFIFILYVLNIATSYLFVYKSSIINVAQKNYIVNIIKFIFFVMQNVVQILILLITKNYILYYSCSILFGLLGNIAVSRKADQMFPFLKKPVEGRLTQDEKKYIKKNISAMFSHNLGTFIVFSTDNMIIAKFIGIVEVGLYSNYTMIINAIQTLVDLIFNSLNASIGNLMHSTSKEKSYEIFKNVLFATHWMVGFCAVSLYVLMNPFITLWLGEKYTFQQYVVFFIVLNFFLNLVRRPANTFKQTVGLFWNDRYKPFFESAVNLIASLILVKYYGIVGVFMGTTLSTLTVCFWIEPYILYRRFYDKSVFEYFEIVLKYISITIISAILISKISKLFFSEVTLGSFIVQMLLCVVVTNGLFWFVFRKSSEMEYMKNTLDGILKKILKRM